ncbi:MAG: hypothetical protein Q4A83_07440 [Bacillota bacterium]|nr:hypothetical protein [Bacillota bacterium]
MRRLFQKKFVKYGVISAVIIIIALIIVFKIFGTGELTMFNSKSITDWKLGGSVEGISSPEDGESADCSPFVWFDEDGKTGLRNEDTGTCYYMSKYPLTNAGKFCVTGFESPERVYSIMGIRVGDSELDAKTLLLDSGYSVVGGGLNSMRAVNGCITIELLFEHGSVIRIAAYIN